MKTAALCALVLVADLTSAQAKSGVAHDEVAVLAMKYQLGLFEARPHLATFMGDHRFDGVMMDLSEGALDKRRKELHALITRVEALVARAKNEPIALDDRVDLEILHDGARLELLYLEKIRDYAWDARLVDSFPYYDPREIVAGRIADIMHGDFAPEDKRRHSVVSQLGALPRYLGEVEGWLAAPYRGKKLPADWRKPPKVYVEHAITTNRGRIGFLDTEVRTFVGADPKGRAALDAAIAALKKYQAFLEKDLLAKADGDWRLGRALYDEKFPLALQTVHTPDEMVTKAEADFARSRTALGALARKLGATLFKGQALPTDDAAVIGKVKDALSVDHAKPAELVAAHGRRLDALRAFITEHKLVTLPPRDTLSVEPMPTFKRGSNAAEYLAPGVLEQRPSFHSTYYVDPIDPTWSPERVESYLRGQNDYEVELVAAHEAYPGHHTQFAAARTSFDPLRAVLWNGPMVEGWAVYGTSQLVAAGWGADKNDRYRFFDLRGRMISASNTIIDIKLQRGQMTDEEAVRFMVEQGFQEKAMAEKKLLRAKLDSTQLCQYFLGLDEIEELRREVQKQHPKDFDLAAFHRELIGHGSIAVRFLRDYIVGQKTGK